MKFFLIAFLSLIALTACGPSAKETAALESLKKLDAYTQTGVVHLKYKELLGEAKYAVNNLNKPAPQSAGDLICAALSCYETADLMWGDYKGMELSSDLIHDSWRKGREQIKKAQDLME